VPFNPPVSTFCGYSTGSRYLMLNPAAGSDPVALLLEGDPDDPDVSCVSLYVQDDGTLGEAPYWATPEEWENVYPHGEEIIPGSTYRISADYGGGPTETVELRTFAWGDVNDDGGVNVADVLLIIAGYQHDFSNAPLHAVDLMSCTPDGVVGLSDVMAAIGAYQGKDYADTICPMPCAP
jgi:hypothetical protein